MSDHYAQTTKNIEEITILRGIAISGIVLLHVTAYFLGSAKTGNPAYNISLALNQLARFTLPMFLVISGFGLAYNYNNAKGVSFKAFIGKRTRTVFFPYLYWSAVYFLFYIFFLKKIPVGTKVTDLNTISPDWWSGTLIFLKNLLFGWNYVHLYFIILIFQFYLIYPFIIRKLAHSQRQKTVLAAGFAFYLILMVYIFYFRKLTGHPYFDIFVKYYWQMFIAWYFYFLFGLMIGLNYRKFEDMTVKNFGLITVTYFLTLIAVLGEAFYYGPAFIGKLTSLRVTILFNTIPAVFFYFRLSRLLKDMIPGLFCIFKKMGQASFGIYFVHLIVLYLGSVFFNRLNPDLFNFNRRFYLFILFFFTLTGSFLFTRLADKFFSGKIYKSPCP